MTYAITSRRTENEGPLLPKAGVPIHIKVPGRENQDQPFVGFATRELGEQFLSIKNLPSEDYCVVAIEEGIDTEYHNNAILIFENERQLIDMEKDREGYDYENHIHRSAL